MFRFGDPGGRVYGSAGTNAVNIVNYWGFATTSVLLTSGGGRNTGTCLNVPIVNSGGYALRTLDSQATWGMAFGFKADHIPTANCAIAQLKDAGSKQLELRLYSDGTLKVTRNGTVLGATTFSLTTNIWYHIEWLSTINSATGTSQVKINEASQLSLTGQNTRNTSNNSANQVLIGSDDGSSGWNPMNLYYDDIIIYDAQTTDPAGNVDIHDFIGDCALNWSLPSGAGTTTNFTPDSGSNYARLADTTVDDDTSYVESSLLNDIDSYATANLPTNTTSVKSLATIHYCRKTDAGGKQMGSLIRSGSTNYLHANNIYLLDSYLYQFRNWGQNPSGIDWTVSDVNALESGQKVLS